jgi:hypothetical protein
MINGILNRRTSLVANTIQVIDFSPYGVDKVDLALMASAKVCYKLNTDVVTLVDTTANYLNGFVPEVTIDKVNAIKKIAVISDTDVEIQWDFNKEEKVYSV